MIKDKKTRVAPSNGEHNRWVAQYYDADMKLWFDIGDSRATREDAEQHLKAELAREPHPALTHGALTALSMIAGAAEGNHRVGRTIDGTVFTGTARSIGDADGRSLRQRDVRDGYLRVTLDGGGVDAYWPVVDLMGEVHEGTFVPRLNGA